ncbi:MAG TPA: nucleotide pyrophosphohydrolase [Elusimicrobiota bacterium]|nr:nucleotide pyrophosphohydrolase [Elusimicrobiota bacterium]
MDRRALLKRRIEKFSRERKWGKYHTPKNLAMAMVKEAAEVVEIFQWLTPAQAARLTAAQRAHLSEELADTFVYLTKIAGLFDIDLVEAALAKMDKNELKYPAALNQGRIRKIRR